MDTSFLQANFQKHTLEFKAEALKLADKVGVAAAARQLSLYESQIYGWRKAVQYDPIMTREEMRQALFEYIEVDYNRTRSTVLLGI